MIRIVMEVNAPPDAVHGVKETMAMYCERFGDTRIVSIQTDGMGPGGNKQNFQRNSVPAPATTEQPPEQMTIGGKPWQQGNYSNRGR